MANVLATPQGFGPRFPHPDPVGPHSSWSRRRCKSNPTPPRQCATQRHVACYIDLSSSQVDLFLTFLQTQAIVEFRTVSAFLFRTNIRSRFGGLRPRIDRCTRAGVCVCVYRVESVRTTTLRYITLT